MKGFVREMQKTIFRLPCLLLILSALVLNGCLLYTNSSGEMIAPESYKKANEFLEELPESERMEFPSQYGNALETGEWTEALLFTKDAVTEQLLIREFEKRLSRLDGYADYLNQIQEKAKRQTVSIFQNTSDYTKREIQAYADAFSPLIGTKLSFVNSDTFLSATEFAVTDLLVLAVLFYIVSSMVIYEKEHGLFSLLRSAKEGRGALICSKMLVGMTGALMLTLLFGVENLLISIGKYGDLDFLAPLQSVYQYDTAAVRMNIGQFFLLFWATKAAVFMVISLIILFLGLKAKNTMNVYLGAAIVLGISIVFYTVGADSGLPMLHYCNLIYWMKAITAYRFYFYLNFFGCPVSITAFVWGCLLLSGVLIGILNRKLFTGKNFAVAHAYLVPVTKNANRCNQSPVVCSASDDFGYRTFSVNSKRNSLKRKKHVNVSVFSHEMYKLLISGQGLLLLCFCIVLQLWMYGQKDTRVSMDEYYYQQYMSQMAGEMDEQKEAFLIREQEAFQRYELLLKDALEDYEEQRISEPELNALKRLVTEETQPKAAFERLLGKAEYARKLQVPLVYETGYLELSGLGMNGYQDDVLEAALFVTALILLITPYFAGEYSGGMMKLISTQYFGRRKTLTSKVKAVALTAVPIGAAVYLPRLLYIGKVYGYDGIRESVNTISELSGSFYNGSILGYLILIYCLRIFTVGVTIALIIAVSVNRKNIAQAISILMILLVFPMVLQLIGILMPDNDSLNALYSANLLLNQGGGKGLLFGVCILLLLLAGSVDYIMEIIGKEQWGVYKKSLP